MPTRSGPAVANRPESMRSFVANHDTLLQATTTFGALQVSACIAQGTRSDPLPAPGIAFSPAARAHASVRSLMPTSLPSPSLLRILSVTALVRCVMYLPAPCSHPLRPSRRLCPGMASRSLAGCTGRLVPAGGTTALRTSSCVRIPDDVTERAGSDAHAETACTHCDPGSSPKAIKALPSKAWIMLGIAAPVSGSFGCAAVLMRPRSV